jgi:hypothetical protein
VTASDTAAPQSVGTSGNLKVITSAGRTVTFTTVPAGFELALQVAQVMATGTTGVEHPGDMVMAKRPTPKPQPKGGNRVPKIHAPKPAPYGSSGDGYAGAGTIRHPLPRRWSPK